jgi:hypothetical protein
MALKSGQFDGGTTRAKVSSVISHTRKDWFEIEFVADPDNTGTVYLGPVTVDNAGTDAVMKLKAGYSKRFGPYHQGSFQLDPTTLYVVGSAASQVCYVNAITAEGRRIPIQGPGTVTDA